MGDRHDGIRPSIGSLMQFETDLPEEHKCFVSKSKIFQGTGTNYIIMQLPWMVEVLQETAIGFQTDTSEGSILEHDLFDGTCDLHMISAYSAILKRWVPVLLAIIFGRSADDYKPCFEAVFDSYEADSWEDFINHDENFCGFSRDWSEAERKAISEALKEFALCKFNKTLTDEEVGSFQRSCMVHFERSFRRVLKNGNIIPAEEADEARKLVDNLKDPDSSFSDFRKSIEKLCEKFPRAKGWISWYLEPKKAKSFFPACQKFTERENERFDKLSKDTNAQENLIKQWTEQWQPGRTKGKNKNNITETILKCYKWMNSWGRDYDLVQNGMSTRYNQFPRSDGKTKRTKRHKNDGRPKDTTSALLGSQIKNHLKNKKKKEKANPDKEEEDPRVMATGDLRVDRIIKQHPQEDFSWLQDLPQNEIPELLPPGNVSLKANGPDWAIGP